MVYIYNQGQGSFFNMALEEYLFYERSDIRPILLLWQNENTIVVGRNQNTISEIDVEYVREKNIDVVRRLTGGGAVYHDKGNLNFTYITKENAMEQFNFEPFIKNIVNTLDYFGVKSEYTGRNDITIQGKKFSGNAQARHKNSLMHHGTIMYDSNLSVLSKCLNPSKKKLVQKGISSVKSRVCNLMDFLPKEVSLEMFRNRIIDEFKRSSGEDVHEYMLSQSDIDRVESIADKKYSTWNWNYGKSPDYNVSCEKRFECGTIQLMLRLDRNIIKHMNIYGDFFSKKDIDEISKKLIGVSYDVDSIASILSEIDLSSYIGDLTVENIVSLFFPDINAVK